MNIIYYILLGSMLTTFKAFASIEDEIPKVNYDFVSMQNTIIDISNAKNISQRDTYEYVLTYKGVQAASFYVDKWYSIKADGYDNADKEVIIATEYSNSRPPFIKYSCNVIEYKDRGKSRGQYNASVSLFKARDGKTLVAVDQDNDSTIAIERPIKKDIKFVKNDRSIQVEYSDSYSDDVTKIRKRLTIFLNSSLDCLIEMKSRKMSNFKKVAYVNGGKAKGIIDRSQNF